MIKITFEVSEDFIEKQSDPDYLAEMTNNGKINPVRVMMNMISYSALSRQLKEGKTEFTVTPEKLDERSMVVYEGAMPDICALAAFSEIDKEKEEDEQ